MPTERRTLPSVPTRPPDVAAVLEAYVERVSRLVLHAAALAERMERRGHGVHGVSVLWDAVARGERAIVGAVRHHVGPLRPERRSGVDRRQSTRA